MEAEEEELAGAEELTVAGTVAAAASAKWRDRVGWRCRLCECSAAGANRRQQSVAARCKCAQTVFVCGVSQIRSHVFVIHGVV